MIRSSLEQMCLATLCLEKQKSQNLFHVKQYTNYDLKIFIYVCKILEDSFAQEKASFEQTQTRTRC